MATFSHLFFDLDGTLLDTISDIALAISAALKDCGFARSYDKVSARPLLGDGADALLRRALKGLSDKPEDFLRLKEAYFPHYKAYQGISSDPFEGMENTLDLLRKQDIDLVIVTNKPDHLAKIIIKEKLPSIPFCYVLGHKEGNPVKPDPFLIESVLQEKGWEKKDCLYVGDSHVDIDTARNAGMKVALCTWGYDHYDEALLDRADYVLHRSEDLLEAVK